MRNRIIKPDRSTPGRLLNTLSGLSACRTDRAVNEHGIAFFGHAEIAALAHELWEARGFPQGSPAEDWLQATHLLRARAEGLEK